MLSRCRYPERDMSGCWAKKGITVCSRWESSFDAFAEDMGERPAGKTLDRIDSSKNYEPNNCRWATPVEQARNTRRNTLTFFQALEIAVRMNRGESAKALSIEFEISESLPREIHKGRTWKDAYEAAKRIA